MFHQVNTNDQKSGEGNTAVVPTRSHPQGASETVSYLPGWPWTCGTFLTQSQQKIPFAEKGKARGVGAGRALFKSQL